MAKRPIFIPLLDGTHLVSEMMLPLHWHSGFAPIQKEKNIRELQASAKQAGIEPILEISTKSSYELGRQLSAFNLRIDSERYGWLPLESVFQGSKVYEGGGPFPNLYHLDPREARSAARSRDVGKIVGFEFDEQRFPSEPKTLFYDWLFLKSIYALRGFLDGLNQFEGFSDIEFNPTRSINCQARSVALYVALLRRNLLGDALSSVETFTKVLEEHHYAPELYLQAA